MEKKEKENIFPSPNTAITASDYGVILFAREDKSFGDEFA